MSDNDFIRISSLSKMTRNPIDDGIFDLNREIHVKLGDLHGVEERMEEELFSTFNELEELKTIPYGDISKTDVHRAYELYDRLLELPLTDTFIDSLFYGTNLFLISVLATSFKRDSYGCSPITSLQLSKIRSDGAFLAIVRRLNLREEAYDGDNELRKKIVSDYEERRPHPSYHIIWKEPEDTDYQDLFLDPEYKLCEFVFASNRR